jgi:hypothetical protein
MSLIGAGSARRRGPDQQCRANDRFSSICADRFINLGHVGDDGVKDHSLRRIYSQPVGGVNTGDGSTTPSSTNRNTLLGGLARMILGGATLQRRRVGAHRK